MNPCPRCAYPFEEDDTGGVSKTDAKTIVCMWCVVHELLTTRNLGKVAPQIAWPVPREQLNRDMPQQLLALLEADAEARRE